MKGLVVFHRHGHRAPFRNVFSDGPLADIEHQLWQQLLPKPETFSELSTLYPVINHPANPQLRDVAQFPFGILTSKGITHLEVVGRAFKERWASVFKDAAEAPLHLYATNYQRTQASGQAFLRGMGLHRSQNRQGTAFSVRHIAECSLAFYEGRPQLAVKLVERVQKQAAFRNLDTAIVRESTAAMAAFLPGLVRSAHAQGPFDWMSANDFYVCRREHSLLSTIPPPLLEIEQHVKAHVADRYGVYYSDPLHLAHLALPMLKDLERSITAALEHPQQHSFYVFSCHDVNLLGLIYALKCAPAPADVGGRFWPEYGATLAFEVCQESSPSSSSSPSEATINVVYNQGETPIASFTLRHLRENVMRAMEQTISAHPLESD